MNEESNDLSNEAEALADILTWSADLPGWQRDALRLLCGQTKLEPADITALVAICKGDNPPGPLDTSHIRDPAASHAVVSLGALHGLANVNALAPGERLVLRQDRPHRDLWRQRRRQIGIRPRPQAALPRTALRRATPFCRISIAGSGGVPTASIDFFIGGQKRSATWNQGGSADPMLSAVSVFDSRTANVHVENTNDLAYTPLPLRILAGLAQACQDVKAKLSAEIKTLEQQTPVVLSKPECKPDTAVGKVIASLSGKTKPDTIEKLAGLTAQEEARLQTLITDLSGDPARTVRQLQTQETRITAAIDQIEQLIVGASDGNRTTLREAHFRLTTARDAAAAASASLFAEEPLPDIGSDIWKALWEAARTYSRAAVYPGQPFPVTASDAHCVLCQQPLGEEAARRLTSFEAFVQDESKPSRRGCR